MWAKAPGEKATGQGMIQYDLMLFFAMYIEEYRKIQQRDAQSILLTAILIAMFGNVSEVCQACNNNVGKTTTTRSLSIMGEFGTGDLHPKQPTVFCFDQGCLSNDTYYILLFNDTCIITNIHTINRYWPSDVEIGMGQSRGPQSKGAYPVMDALRQLNLAGNMFMFKALPTKMDETWGSRNARCYQIEGVNGSWVLPRSPCSGGACEVEFGVFPNACDMAKQQVKWYTLPSGKHTKSYWKLPFIVDLPIKNSDFP